MRPAFLITIDTEGDNLWSGPAEITTENSRALPRFQALCEQYGLKPVYLTNYEMVCCAAFVEFARDVLRRDAGEVGAHLHPWNSPPLRPLTSDDHACRPYVTEYPPDVIHEKVRFLTRLLEATFEVKMISHRAGRWGFDGLYARALIENGYAADCWVTPGVSWKSSLGNPAGVGGPDYTDCPGEPYFLSLEDVCRPGDSPLLEVPVTIRAASPAPVERLRQALPPRSIPRRALGRRWPPLTWLRPNGRNRAAMLRLLRQSAEDGSTCVEFMLHSSELMAGGSPNFPDREAVERLYVDLDAVFAVAGKYFRSTTLAGFAADFSADAKLAPAAP